MSAHGNHGEGHGHGAGGGGGVHHTHIPYWKRAHGDWRFWVGVVLMFLAMIVYLMSFDLSVRPGPRPSGTAAPGAVGRP